MLSRPKIFSKQNLGVAVTAAAVMFGLFIGVAGPGKAQDKGATPATPAKPAMTQKEYDEANAAVKEKDPVKRLQDLDTWKKDFPTTDYLSDRQNLYLDTYAAQNPPMARQAFDETQEILKTRPNYVRAYAVGISMVMSIKPAPSAADLDAGQKIGETLAFTPDTVFSAANKPQGVDDTAWAQAKDQTKAYAEKVLLQIYAARKDPKREVDDLTKLLKADPTFAAASYQLGYAMLNVIKAENKPENQPVAFWQFARAAAYSGPGAFSAQEKQVATNFLNKAYTTFHGSTDGLNDLLAAAAKSPFPPDSFHIDSTVDIAKKEQAKEDAARAADPLVYMYSNDIKARLLKDDSFWDGTVKDAQLPPADDKTTPPTPQYFNAKIVSMTPATRPKEIIVAIEKGDVADAKLEFDSPLAGKMEPGETIQFYGQAKEWTKDPFMITFLVDPKEGLKGWTGKNTPGRGAGRGAGAKGTSKGAAAK